MSTSHSMLDLPLEQAATSGRCKRFILSMPKPVTATEIFQTPFSEVDPAIVPASASPRCVPCASADSLSTDNLSTWRRYVGVGIPLAELARWGHQQLGMPWELAVGKS